MMELNRIPKAEFTRRGDIDLGFLSGAKWLEILRGCI